MTNRIKENLIAVVATIGVLIVLWFGFDAFFALVGGIYIFLNTYIWAFFAGVIAFILAVSIVMLMFKITLLIFGLIVLGLLGIASLFIKK